MMRPSSYLSFLALAAFFVSSSATIVYSGAQQDMQVYTTYMGSACTGTPFNYVYSNGLCYVDSTGTLCTTGASCALYYSTSGSSIQSFNEKWSGASCSGTPVTTTKAIDTGDTTECNTSGAPYNTQYSTSTAVPSTSTGTAAVAYFPNSKCNGMPYSTAIFPLDTCFVVSASMSGMTKCTDSACALSLYESGNCDPSSATTTDPIAGGFTIDSGCVVDPKGSTWQGTAVYVLMTVGTASPSAAPTAAPTILTETGTILVVVFTVGVALVLVAIIVYMSVTGQYTYDSKKEERPLIDPRVRDLP